MQVCICICTCDRPEGLRRLLAGIEAQRLVTLSASQISILVVDNGAHEGAAAVCRGYAERARFGMRLVTETRRGLVWARNRALAQARAHGADAIALIDDDETPAPDWLEALVGVQRRTGAAVCVGPVVPTFSRPPPAWAAAGGFFAKRLAARDGWVRDAYTANALVDLRAAAGIAFDMRFNTMGGEDTYFFRTILLAGHRIAWAEEAVVYDTIPDHRARLSWLFARWFRSGNVEAYLGARAPETVPGRLTNAARGLARLAGGGLTMLRATVSLDRSRLFASVYTLCRGGGLIAAALGLSYGEYHPARYR